MTTRPIDRLLAVMARLRDRENGCPWNLEQSFATIAPYTIEEAYEVADAIERDDMAALKTSSAICCCRSCSMPEWRRKPGISGSRMSPRQSRRKWNGGIRMCLAIR